MFKNQFSRLASLVFLMLFTCGTYAEIHPISGWDLQVDISGSGADTVWMLNGFTFIDYNMPIEDIVYGVTEGGANNPAPTAEGLLPNADNPNLYQMLDRANNEHVRTTQFGGQSLWSDGNGDKYDFFIFESSYENQTETFLVHAILDDGSLGAGMAVVGSNWRPSTLDPPEPSMRDELGLIRTSAPQSDKGPWGIAFKVTDLKDANGDPLTNYSLIQGLQIASAGADFCLICAAKAGGPPVALNPSPVEGSLETTSTVSLSWDKGNRMTSQKIYLSTNRADVAAGAEAALIATQAETSLDAQVEGGQTYYWRVDTIDDADALAPGNVWNFQTVPNTASQPIPYDGGKFVAIAPTLTWVPGLDAQSYTVVFGTDSDAVSAATEGVVVTEPSYTPDPLLNETTYYWRVDAFDGTTTRTGTVWQFTTARETGGLLGRYYSGEFGTLILTRIDPVIDIAWADASDPNMPVNTDADEFSVRWQGELEVPEDGSYTFTLFSSDFARLIIDGIEVIDDWNDHAEQEVSGVIYLTAGYHGIAVDHWKEGADTNVDVRLSWESGMFTREIVPSGALIPEPKAIPVWPLNGANEMAQAPRLMWMGIAPDAKHQVYLGQTPESLSAAGEVEGDTSLLVEGLDPGSLYYWRVDEVVGDQTTEGRVWQFTTAADLVIDDGENYTDRDDQAIWMTWLDGYAGNGSGSYAGYPVPPYAEEIVVHGGRQSLPLVYDNTGQFNNANNQKTGATYSEISRSVQPQNWSDQKTLQLWYHGSSPASFTYDTESETYATEGVGLGLGGTEDNCTFVYGQLTGDGTIIARIDPWRASQAYVNAARVGVMIRESLDPDAKSVTMSLGGDAIVRTIWRTEAGANNQTVAVQTAVWFPHYVRIVREGDVIHTSYSPDGVNWAEDIDVESISMNATVYIGLIVSSNYEGTPLMITFADVQVAGNVVPQPFAEFKVIGLAGSAPEPLYIKVKDSSGGEASLVHPDADAILTSIWKSWSIDLQALAGQGLNLNAVDTITLGVGDPAKMGGNGAVLFDDIRLLTE